MPLINASGLGSGNLDEPSEFIGNADDRLGADSSLIDAGLQDPPALDLDGKPVRSTAMAMEPRSMTSAPTSSPARTTMVGTIAWTTARPAAAECIDVCDNDELLREGTATTETVAARLDMPDTISRGRFQGPLRCDRRVTTIDAIGGIGTTH